MSNFFKNVVVVFRGALIGQIIPILAMPLLSRIYSPAEFGLYGSLMSLGVIFSSCLMLQLEVAVVLPKEDDRAEHLARSAIAIGVYIGIFLTTLMALFLTATRVFHVYAHLSWWLVLAPFLAFFLTFVWLANYIAIRHQNFRDIGASAANLQLGFCSLALISGLVMPSLGSLVVSRCLGQIYAVFSYKRARAWLFNVLRRDGWPKWQDLRETVLTYRKFPFFSTPYTFITSLSREVVSVILIFFNYPAAAGYYTLARSILLIPSSLLSTSIGQIFYREASKSLHRPAFQSFTYALMIAIAAILAPGCIYIAEWGPVIFNFAFGQSWTDAGHYAMLFMPVALLYSLTAWVARIFEVTGKQDILFKMLLIFDAVSISTLLTVLIRGSDPATAVGAYVACQVVYFLVYLGFVFRLIGLSAARFALLIGVAVGCAGLQLLVRFILGNIINAQISLFVAETAMTVIFCGGLMILAWKKIGRSRFLLENYEVSATTPENIL